MQCIDLRLKEWQKSFRRLDERPERGRNADPEVKGRLAGDRFQFRDYLQIQNEDQPRGVFVVENGECVRAGDYDGTKPDWDMRAPTSTTGRSGHPRELAWPASGLHSQWASLKFLSGDFKGMIKDPRMAGPFVKASH